MPIRSTYQHYVDQCPCVYTIQLAPVWVKPDEPCLFSASTMPTSTSSLSGSPSFLDRVRAACRRNGYTYRTEETYLRWIVRYVKHHGTHHPREFRNCSGTRICGRRRSTRTCSGRDTPVRRARCGRSKPTSSSSPDRRCASATSEAQRAAARSIAATSMGLRAAHIGHCGRRGPRTPRHEIKAALAEEIAIECSRPDDGDCQAQSGPPHAAAP
jgi:hypothetical protein